MTTAPRNSSENLWMYEDDHVIAPAARFPVFGEPEKQRAVLDSFKSGQGQSSSV